MERQRHDGNSFDQSLQQKKKVQGTEPVPKGADLFIIPVRHAFRYGT